MFQLFCHGGIHRKVSEACALDSAALAMAAHRGECQPIRSREYQSVTVKWPASSTLQMAILFGKGYLDVSLQFRESLLFELF